MREFYRAPAHSGPRGFVFYGPALTYNRTLYVEKGDHMKTGSEGLEIGSRAHFVHAGDPACRPGTVVKTNGHGASVQFDGADERVWVELGDGHSDWHKPDDCPEFTTAVAPADAAVEPVAEPVAVPATEPEQA